jgi:NAD(P)-dependent dehydrogenase (short-subunit alcohol dehydrogenase family)
MEFQGKVAIVTGGGTGIGRATARLLARKGARVIIVGRRLDPIQNVAAEICHHGGAAIGLVADLTIEGDMQAVAKRIENEFGRLDLAVNAAGVAYVGTVAGSTEESFDQVLTGNLKTAWLSMKYEIPIMATTGGGSIVNLSSGAGLKGIAHGGFYSAAKHAVIGLSKSAALEVASFGIRINVVCPGTTRTEQFEGIVAGIMPGISADDAAEKFGYKVPLGHIAQPDEIASSIVWLLGPDAGYVSGAVVPVDGGVAAS